MYICEISIFRVLNNLSAWQTWKIHCEPDCARKVFFHPRTVHAILFTLLLQKWNYYRQILFSMYNVLCVVECYLKWVKRFPLVIIVGKKIWSIVSTSQESVISCIGFHCMCSKLVWSFEPQGFSHSKNKIIDMHGFPYLWMCCTCSLVSNKDFMHGITY